MAEKRVTQQTASDEIYSDDWFLKDSVNHGTTKIQPSVMKTYFNQGMATSQNLTDEATARQNMDSQLATGIGKQMNNLADFYSTTKSYVVGDVAILQSGELMRCTSPTSGSFNPNKWEQITVDELFDDLNFSADAISYDNTSSGLESDNVQDAIDETITKLSAVGSASGDIATFNDGSDLSMPKLEVAIEPVQDLHGYDSPWVGGAGKNKCDTHGYGGIGYNGAVGTAVTFTDSTIPVTVNKNLISYSVPAWGGVVFKTPSLSSGTYHFHAELSSTVNRKTLYVLNSNNVVKEVNNYSDSGGTLDVSRTFESGDCIAIWIGSNNAVDITITNMQVESGNSYTTFAPYSNICPISGWDEANVTRTGKNLADGEYTANYLGTSGELVASNAYRCTDYVDVTGLTKLKTAISTVYQSMWLWRIASYDANKSFIELSLVETKSAGAFEKEITLPVNAKYIRACALVQSTDWTIYDKDKMHTYTIDLDGTRYGGTLDVVSGVMTVDRAMKTLTNIVTNVINTHYFYGNVQASTSNQLKDVLSSAYKSNISASWQSLKDGECQYGDFFRSSGQKAIMIRDNAFSNVNDYLQARGNETIVYPLETPIEVQLTPTLVKSLKGVNNVYADCGAILDAEYIRDMTTIINYILEQLNA